MFVFLTCVYFSFFGQTKQKFNAFDKETLIYHDIAVFIWYHCLYFC